MDPFMDQTNFTKSLATLLNRRPFRPFEIRFVDGERLMVEHPEAVRYSGQGIAVYFDKKGELSLFDHEGVAKLGQRARETASK
jgi:hypothetical protein